MTVKGGSEAVLTSRVGELAMPLGWVPIGCVKEQDRGDQRARRKGKRSVVCRIVRRTEARKTFVLEAAAGFMIDNLALKKKTQREPERTGRTGNEETEMTRRRGEVGRIV